MEAAFVGLVLISSIAVVTSLETKPPSIPPSRAPVEDAVRDLLMGLEHLSRDDRYTSQLERAISQAVLGNSTTLDSYVKRTMPVGSECRLFIDNGKVRKLLAGPVDRLARESVSASQLYHPTWAYALVVPTLELVNQFQPLQVQGFAVSQGALVKEAGVPVQVRVTTNQGVYEKATITGIRAGAASPYLHLKNASGNATFVQNEVAAQGQSQRVYEDVGTPSLRPSGSFTVPANMATLAILGAFQGGTIAYTFTLTAPNGTAYPFQAAGSGSVTVTESIAASAGQWNVVASGTILGGVPLANLTVDAIGQSRTLNMTLVVGESGNTKALPAGANVTITLPYTFERLDATNRTQDGWRNINTSKDGRGARITAELATPLQGAARELNLTVDRPLGADAMYRMHVELGNHTTMHAHFVLRTLGATMLTDNPLLAGAYVTAPKPMAPGMPTTWGVAFALPSTTPVGIPELVTRVDVYSQDGSPLFASVQNAGPSGSWSRVSASHIQWVGASLVAPNEAMSFVARVTPDATESPWEPMATLPVEFRTGSQFRLGEQARPYVFTGAIPPPSAGQGYEVPLPDPGTVPPSGAATLGVETYLRALRVQGNSTYRVSPANELGSLQEQLRVGMLRSGLALDKTQVHLGETVTITADYQGLRDRINLTVADSGGTLVSVDWRIQVEVVDPAQGFESNMSRWRPTLQTSSTAGAMTVEFTPPADGFYGPYAVVAKAVFTVRSTVLSADITQTARLLAVVDVVPDGGQSETALYWVSLECWLPDWM